ncbi:putative tubulin polyglutamylase [Phytophthora fragariae]|uniref:Tubulin--tyrosine ligase-like protein 9 n=1 Tax=Phytophthora fragariae TaxID=53985 RepID=A0A6A3S929_9STRA|nr:putative tubulin polyglutamylase [Phytophthora fragariae]KAE9009643.1 putative tubulin polyglutamylase [Phytophthora fragariae]KAE9111120.1 putative tubulin polyglutamylase [Phytophthora fragariae]KAE9111399.1 putative tubulin polyglutamylase [Phytophthora fragariae]KAE9144256.1 putative tubulin polyglutamylase [Phytophthora fragariae]
MERKLKRPDSREERRVVRFRTSLHNTVRDVMQRQGGWIETSSDLDWDLHWADVGWIRENLDAFTPLQDHQRINHFQNHYELTRKDLLVKNLKRIKRQLERSGDAESRREAELYEFWAATFVLPHEYGMFLEEFKRTPGGRWIMKPVGKAQGRGIFLFEKLSDISEWKRDASWKGDGAMQAKTADTYIVQKYVESPYLLGGKKFDLRLYVLVTSFSPLSFWLYRAGFARFSHTRYSQSRGDMDNLFMHLTNASVQRGADDYDERLGCKWPLHSLKMFLISKHGQEAVDRLFFSIQSLITRSLLAVQPTIIQDRHCFELYGYDVLIDSALKPWLIEVNASPSLTADTDADYSLKANLVQHTLEVVDLERRREGDELHIGGFDLIWNNGSAVPNAKPNGYSSYLGCTFEAMDVPERG